MTCETALERISAALDSELTPEDKAQLERHLAQCDACRALYADLASLHEACGGLEVLPPPALKEQIMGNLPPQAKPAKVVSVPWKRWGAMAASLALVAMAAWQLPRFLFTPPESGAQPASDEAAAVTDNAVPTTGGSVVAGDDPGDITLEGYAFDVQGASAPTPLPDYVDGTPVNVNAVSSQKQAALDADSLDDSMAKAKAADTSAMPVAYSAYLETGSQETAYNGIAEATVDADAVETPAPLLITGAFRMSKTTSPEAVSGDGGDSSASDTTERPEPHPVMGEDEIVAASFPAESVSTSYCGVLTLSGGATLNDIPTQVLENGETCYELPDGSFRALVRELTAGEVDFDLRMTGEDISSSAQIGLVIVLP